MRLILAVGLIVFSTTAFALSGTEATYAGGSAKNLKPGDAGTFDVSGNDALVFVAPSERLSITYSRIVKMEYRRELTHHLGVAPAIAVGLIKARDKKHVFTITFTDEAGVPQAMVFEVPKSAARPMIALFEARAPLACIITSEHLSCPGNNIRRGPQAGAPLGSAATAPH